MDIGKVLVAALFALVVGSAGCGGGGGAGGGPLTYDEFLAQLPDAVCDYYLACEVIKSSERSECPEEIADDIQKDFSCNAARGLFSQLEPSMRSCVDGQKKACGTTDDLDLFCPQLSLLEDECN